MAWDFATEPKFQEELEWVEDFCNEKVEPLDYVFPYTARSPDPVVKAYVRELQQELKDRGLWAIFLDEELGGPGYGQLKLALLNEIIGRYPGAPQVFGAAAPDTGNIELLPAYGTDEQKERWLEPLLNQDMFSAYSMTEPQGGSDPNLSPVGAPTRAVEPVAAHAANREPAGRLRAGHSERLGRNR
jgi:alkylation response protein AidB-like acyl-CoA dehydrogenase